MWSLTISSAILFLQMIYSMYTEISDDRDDPFLETWNDRLIWSVGHVAFFGILAIGGWVRTIFQYDKKADITVKVLSIVIAIGKGITEMLILNQLLDLVDAPLKNIVLNQMVSYNTYLHAFENLFFLFIGIIIWNVIAFSAQKYVSMIVMWFINCPSKFIDLLQRIWRRCQWLYRFFVICDVSFKDFGKWLSVKLWHIFLNALNVGLVSLQMIYFAVEILEILKKKNVYRYIIWLIGLVAIDLSSIGFRSVRTMAHKSFKHKMAPKGALKAVYETLRYSTLLQEIVMNMIVLQGSYDELKETKLRETVNAKPFLFRTWVHTILELLGINIFLFVLPTIFYMVIKCAWSLCEYCFPGPKTSAAPTGQDGIERIALAPQASSQT